MIDVSKGSTYVFDGQHVYVSDIVEGYVLHSSRSDCGALRATPEDIFRTGAKHVSDAEYEHMVFKLSSSECSDQDLRNVLLWVLARISPAAIVPEMPGSAAARAGRLATHGIGLSMARAAAA